MRLKRLYTSATPQERDEMLLLMLQTIETRKNKKVIARGRLIRERRGPFAGAHFLNNRRKASLRRNLHRILFIAILLLVSSTTFLVAYNIPNNYGAPLIFLYNIGLLMILLIKPYRWISDHSPQTIES
jgi:hypothetical protein